MKVRLSLYKGQFARGVEILKITAGRIQAQSVQKLKKGETFLPLFYPSILDIACTMSGNFPQFIQNSYVLLNLP